MKLKYQFIITEIEDQFVAVPVGDQSDDFSGIIHLNGTAKDIMEMLFEDTSAENIATALSSKYTEVSKDEISDYVNQFISNLKNEGLIDD